MRCVAKVHRHCAGWVDCFTLLRKTMEKRGTMVEQSQTAADPKDSLVLKLDEPQVAQDEPWKDDALGRDQIARRLTNLIATQSSPFTISIHGNWGTGKTFLLKRWQAQLKHDGFKAIYFNAWEDDSSDDPLLAMLGQLAEHFSEEGIRGIAKQIFRTAIPLFRQNALGLLEKHTGFTLELEERYKEKDFFDAYLQQRSTRNELNSQLCELSAKVRENTGHPTIFIVDELDRCRPTFAIELLERVKHIFDVPDLVFIFGVNRDELCKSLQPVYGQIDADTYLRRFFDMEFNLPKPRNTEAFARYLMERYGLGEFFGALSRAAGDPVHSEDFRYLVDDFPTLWEYLDSSLRDIDYLVRSIAFVGKNMDLRRSIYPVLLGTLITLKLHEPVVYRRFVQGACRASEITDYLDKKVTARPLNREVTNLLDAIEVDLYSVESEGKFDSPTSAIGQLKMLSAREPLSNPEYLSERVQATGNADRLIRQIESHRWSHSGVTSYVTGLIDIHHDMARR